MLVAGGGAYNTFIFCGAFSFTMNDLSTYSYWGNGSAYLELIAGGSAGDIPNLRPGLFAFTDAYPSSFSGWPDGSAYN